MARPTKGTIDYFPHYIKVSKTLFILETDYGNDGYAFWFKLLEILGSTEGMYFNYNSPADVRFLLSKTRVDEGTCLQIIETLALVEAIDKELWEAYRIIWVQNLVDNVKDAFKKRLNHVPKRPVFTSSEDGVSSIILVSAGGNPNLEEFPAEETLQSDDSEEFPSEETGKGKERKLKEMKLKNNIDIRSVYEHWKSKSILTNHRTLTVHIELQVRYKLVDYTVDELKECIDNYSIILSDPDYKLDTKWSLQDFLEKGHFEKFLPDRDPYTFYPKISGFVTAPKKTKFDKDKEDLQRMYKEAEDRERNGNSKALRLD